MTLAKCGSHLPPIFEYACARRRIRMTLRQARPYKDPNADPHSVLTARCQPCLTGNGLLFLLGGGVTPLFAPCAPLLASLCAPCAPFLTSFCAPRASFLTPLRTSLRRLSDGVAGVVLVWAPAGDTIRIAGEATSPNAAAYPKRARAFRRQTRFGSERSPMSGSRFAALLHVAQIPESRH